MIDEPARRLDEGAPRALVPRVLAGLVRRGEDFDAAEDALQAFALLADRAQPRVGPARGTARGRNGGRPYAMSTGSHDAIAGRWSESSAMVTPVVREIYPPRPGIAWFTPQTALAQPPATSATPAPSR